MASPTRMAVGKGTSNPLIVKGLLKFLNNIKKGADKCARCAVEQRILLIIVYKYCIKLPIQITSTVLSTMMSLTVMSITMSPPSNLYYASRTKKKKFKEF